ncbi:hypothetical protein E2F46_09735 [Luteimonas aestuarii]|uniref:Uncharacterized protein n=1 Tax=Luteimonas aestuarii TaxID=453837 RepID=A0A4R5TSD7_9GAMM|nr:hypothetical protein [Luteimonas aestuarii]TDK23802.1 hypothetical protein E2F46_09735 [Luteimonas aestuarii]
MSHAPPRPHAGPAHRIERLQPRIAALASLLLHALLVLIVMLTPPVVVSSGSEAVGGSRIEVQYIGESPPVPSPRPTDRPPADDAAATPPPPASRLQTTPVPDAEATVPLVVESTAQTPVPPRPPQPVPRPAATPQPPAPPPPPTRRPSALRGQPPGMRLEDLAPVNAGPAASAAPGAGRRHQTSGNEASLEVDGYQVIYDLRAEPRLRAWRDAGMTELSLPLPGTRRIMVCPLETALRRGSGPCRMVEPDDPELDAIGDARDVLDMNQVYRLGELLWRGPRPYR